MLTISKSARWSLTLTLSILLGVTWASPTALLAQAQPELEVQPDELTFEADVGGSAPNSQSLTIANAGEGEMDWEATDDADWLIAESSGVLGSGESATVNVIALIDDLDAGTHEATITARAEQADNSPVEVPVTLTLASPGRGELAVDPTRLNLQAQKGGDDPTRTLTIENAGNASMDWTAQTPADWLRLRPESGSLSAGQSRGVRVTPDIGSLNAGDHQTTVSIRSPNAERSPVRVQVRLSLAERPDRPAGPDACDRGESVFSDNFSNPGSGWTQDSGGGFNWGYDEGEYRVFITEPGFLAWAWAPFNASRVPRNFCASVDAKHLVTGSLTELGEVGILFAGNPNKNAFTLFSIANRQFYRVVRWDCGGDGCSADTLVEAVESDAIQPDSFNRLRVIAEGREARLFINDTQVETLSTGTSGALGVLSHSFDEPNMNGRFDNFAVRSLPE